MDILHVHCHTHACTLPVCFSRGGIKFALLMFKGAACYLLTIGGARWIVCVVVGEALTLVIDVISSLIEVLLILLEVAHVNQKNCCRKTRTHRKNHIETLGFQHLKKDLWTFSTKRKNDWNVTVK